jgi:hypothetical protein
MEARPRYTAHGGIMCNCNFSSLYEDMCDALATNLRHRHKTSSLVVFVFANGRQAFVKEHLIALAPYWHLRSGEFVDFVFAGYARTGDAAEPAITFDEEAFVDFLQKFEELGWSYSGKPSVVILQAKLAPHNSFEVRLDVANIVEFDLLKAIDDHVIDSTATFFEDIIAFAAQTNGATSWQLSNAFGAREFGKALAEFTLEISKTRAASRLLNPIRYFRIKSARKRAPKTT